MLNGFCPLIKTPPPPLYPSVMNGQYQDGYNAGKNKNQMKNTPSFTLYFKFWGYFLKNVRYSHQIFYFLLFYISFYISRNHFHKFLELHSTLSEKKIFVTIFPFITNSFNPVPRPLNGQTSLTVTKDFCRRSLKKIGLNLWMVYICKIKSSGKKNTKRREEAECTLHCWPKSSDICDCSRPF